MVALIARRLFGFLVPGSLLLLAGIWFNHSPALLSWRPLAARTTLWLVPLLALLLGWRFNRSKPVYVILVLLLAERAVHFYSPLPGGASDVVTLIVQVVALLLPLNFVLLGLGAERGLFSVHTLPRLLLIMVQPLLVILVATRYPKVLTLLQVDFMPFALPWPGHLAQAGQVFFWLGLAFLLGRWLITKGGFGKRSFLGAAGCLAGLGFFRWLAAFPHLRGGRFDPGLCYL